MYVGLRDIIPTRAGHYRDVYMYIYIYVCVYDATIKSTAKENE